MTPKGAGLDDRLYERFRDLVRERSGLEFMDSRRGDLERSERQLVGYAQSQGIINTAGTGEDGKSNGDTNSLQGASLVSLNSALAAATARRVEAEGAYRQALTSGPTLDVAQSTTTTRGFSGRASSRPTLRTASSRQL